MVSKKRSAIMESVLKLLDERPLSRISVKDVVEDCGINRNTFYYHFEDMPALIEAVIIEEVNLVMRSYSDVSSLEQCYEAATRLCHEHKKAVFHIYNSANRDVLERCLMEICEYVATKFVDHEAEGRNLRPEDREILIHSFKCECFGYAVDWLNRGMSSDLERQFHRMCELRRGSFEIMLERSEAR